MTETYLGKLCTQKHKFEGRDQSERYASSRDCVSCSKLKTQLKQQLNPGYFQAANRAYKAEHREELASKQRNYHRLNPGVQKTKDIRKRATKKKALISLFGEAALRKKWYHNFRRSCAYCQKSITWEQTEWDHIIPLASSGEHSLINLVPSCRDCNRGVNGKFNNRVFDWLKVRGLPIPYWLDRLSLEDWFLLAYSKNT